MMADARHRRDLKGTMEAQMPLAPTAQRFSSTAPVPESAQLRRGVIANVLHSVSMTTCSHDPQASEYLRILRSSMIWQRLSKALLNADHSIKSARLVICTGLRDVGSGPYNYPAPRPGDDEALNSAAIIVLLEGAQGNTVITNLNLAELREYRDNPPRALQGTERKDHLDTWPAHWNVITANSCHLLCGKFSTDPGHLLMFGRGGSAFDSDNVTFVVEADDRNTTAVLTVSMLETPTDIGKALTDVLSEIISDAIGK